MFSPWPVYERVLVNLDNGTAVNGLLVSARRNLLVLADATLLGDTVEPTPLDGEVYIERARVLFMQTAP
jgi:small nuclear ribonucleoprotein (snRNP)-like protein